MIQCNSKHLATVGLMFSGGLDSAVLLAKLLQDRRRVQPFYVATGCQWEAAERAAIDRLLQAFDHPEALPLVDLEMPIEDLYVDHWSLTGLQVPDETTTDDAVYLPARNPLLLLKPALWCARHDIPELAIATLSNNPFPDATRQFCDLFQSLIETSTGARLRIAQPLAELEKRELLNLIAGFPYELTFSCLAPQNGQHCGRCNKCAERATVLKTLASGDPTQYASVDSAFTSHSTVSSHSTGTPFF